MLPLPFHPALGQDIRTLTGVGPQIQKKLLNRGIRRLGDLLLVMPLRYQDRRQTVPIASLKEGEEALVGGTVIRVLEGRFAKIGRRYFQVSISDGTGAISGLWFSYPAHLRTTLSEGQRVWLFGPVTAYRKHLQLIHPDLTIIDGPDPPPEIRPVYPELAEVKPGTVRRIMSSLLKEISGLPAIFPRSWLKDHNLTDPIDALKTLHQPPADRPGPVPKPEESRAWRSLAFFELFFLQLALARSRAKASQNPGRLDPGRRKLVNDFLNLLPFGLTASQRTCLDEILIDMAGPRPMNRLLQGDVGSGKTVVALAAAMACLDSGRQVALMAPTEILARQHFETLYPQARKLGLEIDLLVGGLSEAEKRACRENLALGKTSLVVGTQAIISREVEFMALGLAIVDEQHRFGVAQRLALRAKAEQPDLLVMTATPIPRSLAMTIYGDLDLSTIKGLPPGRRPVQTRVLSPGERDEAYRLLAREVAAGGQAFIVAPRIEPSAMENGVEDLAAAESLFEFVCQDVLSDFKVGLVHGRMKAEEQAQVMEDFRQGKIRALVATTVIEVGLDVGGASLILIEGAERFGLAQLHQLRGRVGRLNRKGICILLSHNEEAAGRLGILARTRDGFILAEEDLKRRGPGDAVGFKQSGLPPFNFARLPRDLPLMVEAKKLAEKMIARDPELTEPSLKLMSQALDVLESGIKADLADAG